MPDNKKQANKNLSEIRKRKEELLEKRREKSLFLIRALNGAFSTDDGRETLRWLMEQCGYQESSMTIDPVSREINVRTLIHNEARRNLYLEIRGYLKPELLKAVEIDHLKQEEPENA